MGYRKNQVIEELIRQRNDGRNNSSIHNNDIFFERINNSDELSEISELNGKKKKNKEMMNNTKCGKTKSKIRGKNKINC